MMPGQLHGKCALTSKALPKSGASGRRVQQVRLGRMQGRATLARDASAVLLVHLQQARSWPSRSEPNGLWRGAELYSRWRMQHVT
jgi:hypothetical protein